MGPAPSGAGPIVWEVARSVSGRTSLSGPGVASPPGLPTDS